MILVASFIHLPSKKEKNERECKDKKKENVSSIKLTIIKDRTFLRFRFLCQSFAVDRNR